MEIFGISLPGLLSQLLLGLVNGSFYAILSLGLAVIFGLLNVINFAHGACQSACGLPSAAAGHAPRPLPAPCRAFVPLTPDH